MHVEQVLAEKQTSIIPATPKKQPQPQGGSEDAEDGSEDEDGAETEGHAAGSDGEAEADAMSDDSE